MDLDGEDALVFNVHVILVFTIGVARSILGLTAICELPPPLGFAWVDVINMDGVEKMSAR